MVNEQFSIEEYANHVCTIDYPIILHNREMFINQKFTPLQMRNDGITKIGLFTANYSTKKRQRAPSSHLQVLDTDFALMNNVISNITSVYL